MQQCKTINIEQFCAALKLELRRCTLTNEGAVHAAQTMSNVLDEKRLQKSNSSQCDSAALAIAAQGLLAVEPCVQKLLPERYLLASYLMQNQAALSWYQKTGTQDDGFSAGHANAQIIGPNGLFQSQQILVGVTLMFPNLLYPEHQHPPEEVYVTLSEGSWWQQGGAWHSPGTQGYVYNPPNIMHAMRSTQQPLLALWCLNVNAGEG